LLVDADPRSARVFEVSLRNAGYSVTHVLSAAEAIEAIEVAIPDLVISDTRLAPSKNGDQSLGLSDGYSLCRRLKDDPVWYAIPFIFLTSSASIEDKIRGLELGVEDFLTKPIYLREIITRIQLVLAKKQREGMEGRTSRASFTGLLSEMGLVDLLSTIDLGRKSGVLELEAPQGRGVVFFRDGRVVDARANKLSGANAIYRMLLWTDGRFEIRFGSCTANEVIEMSTQGLLMEGMRRIDEWQRMREQLPPLDSVFEVDVPEVLARIGEIPDEINPILRAFDGRRTLMEVVDESGIDDLEALATLTKLYFEGLIVTGKAPIGTTTDARVRAGDERKRDTLIGFDSDAGSSVPSPALDAADDHLLLPASTPGDGVAAPPSTTNIEGNTTSEAPSAAASSPVVPVGTGAAILPDPQSTRTGSSATTSQEPAVAKHRGKNRRSKREFADSTSTATKSSSPLATASTAPIISDRNESDEADESPAPAPTADATPPPAEATKPSSSDSSGSQPALTEAASPSNADPSAKSEPVVEAKSEPAVESKPPEPTTAAETEVVAERSRTDAAKTDEPKAEGGTVIQFPSKTRSAGDEKKADEPKPEPVEPKKLDEKKADEKKADEKKAEPKKSEPADGKKKSETGKRERKDSHGDLGDEARAFFSDNSYESAYKKTHDTFDDLEPEAHPDAPNNKKLMYATVGLLVAIVAIVGGLAVYRKYFGVEDATLPQQSLLTNNNSARTDNGNNGTNNSGSGSSQSASSQSAGLHAEADTGVAAANTAAEDTGVDTAASATAEDAGATTASATPEDAGAAVVSNNATQDSGIAAANNTATPTVEDSGVTAAPSGPADLLVAAQRAQNRGAGAATTAYQAYLDAGGNDGAAIARFAFWLANRGDLGRAAEWAERATQLAPDNQLAWYVLGASKMEGPRRDPAAAREAFRRCAQLPGRYSGECRSAF
jgi:CheY-like chemotaxis protein